MTVYIMNCCFKKGMQIILNKKLSFFEPVVIMMVLRAVNKDKYAFFRMER